MYNYIAAKRIRKNNFLENKMIFTSALDSPEGPIVLSDRSLFCVEMGSKSGTVTHISPWPPTPHRCHAGAGTPV